MVKLVVGVSGVIGSGKTSVARLLSSELPNAEYKSFGDVVRAEAVARGRGTSRTELQNTGEEVIAEGWSAFVDKLLTPPPSADTLVVDGIRHPLAIDELARRWPEAQVVLVYIRPSAEVLEERKSERNEPEGAEQHPVELELPDVLARANLVLVDESLAGNVARVVSTLTLN